MIVQNYLIIQDDIYIVNTRINMLVNIIINYNKHFDI